MRLLELVREAYTRPLAELSDHQVQPIHDGRVACPLLGREVAEAQCMTCPRYVRTRTFHGGDGLWLQSTILCDPERGDAITTAG